MGVGEMVGQYTPLFLEALGSSIAYTSQFPHSLLCLAAELSATGALIQYPTPEAEGQGTDKVIAGGHREAPSKEADNGDRNHPRTNGGWGA